MKQPEIAFLSAEVKKTLSHPEQWKTISSRCSEVFALLPEQGWKFFKESHPLREILLMVSGKSRGYWFNGEFYPMEPGTMFLIDGNEEHELQLSPTSSGSIYLWFYFWNRNVIMRVFSEKNETSRDSYVLKLTDGDGFYQRWEELASSFDTPEYPDVLARFKMHLSMAAYQAMQTVGSGLSDGNFRRHVVYSAQCYIREHIRSGIDCGELARNMGYSRYHFSRMFKAYSGVTVQEYIDECRKKIFSVLIAQKTGKKEIASALGFCDVHSLFKWQKKLCKKEQK